MNFLSILKSTLFTKISRLKKAKINKNVCNFIDIGLTKCLLEESPPEITTPWSPFSSKLIEWIVAVTECQLLNPLKI